MRVFLFACALLEASLVRTSAQTTFTLNPNTNFGCCTWFDGSIRPGDRSYVTTGNAQRGLAYNPATDNIILVDRALGGGSPNISGGIYVLTGATGADVRTLSTNGMGGGTFADFAVAVDDAGVIYVGNLVNDGTSSPFKIYRWLSESSGEGPVVIYSGDPGNGRRQRWGDTMDIRGSGATTQILLGTRTSDNVIGTNAAILTTADGGATFTATTLSLDVFDSASGGGIAFGAGNTFWAKNLDVPLRQFSFDLGTGQATTVRSYGLDALPASRTLETLAVDNTNNLLAIVDMTLGVDRVRLYDISNPTGPPALLGIRDFPIDNANGTTTKGYLDFGGSRLYVHNINNGLMEFLVESVPVPTPNIVSHPEEQRILAGRTLRLDVLAYPTTTYQWQRNGTNIPGATDATLIIPNAQTTDAGTYRVVVSNVGGSVTSSEAVVNVINPEDLFHLELLWSAAPGDASKPYVTSNGGANTPNERNIAYNPVSNELYVQQKGAGTTFDIHVVDASTGFLLRRLNTNGVFLDVPAFGSSTGIGLDGIGVGADGALYACNMTADACGCANINGVFRVYRWANSDSTTLPVQVFQGDPAGQTSSFRWGDVIDVRGGGLSTQIMLDNHNTSVRYMAILQPMDETMNSFSSDFFFQDTATPFGTSIGRTFQFGAANTFWQKRRAAPLLESSFDLNAAVNSSPVLAAYTNFPATLGLVGLDLSRNIVAGINFVNATTAPDTLDLYDMSEPDNPLLLAQYNFPINHVANDNFIGRVLFAGDKVFALNGNNGIVAFRVASGPVSSPSILRQPQDERVASGGAVTLGVISADIATFQWQRFETNLAGATNSTLTITSAQLSHAGAYRVIVSNQAGSITSSNATLTVLPVESFHRLAPLWGLAPLSRPYLRRDTDSQGRTPFYRSIAYNALSNELYVIARSSASSGLTVQVLNATTGEDLHQLDTTGIAGGSIILLSAGVAGDGSIYAANMDTSGTTVPAVYNLYRWENSSPSTLPVLVFSGEPAGLNTSARWGDTLDVRGQGADTEIIIDANSGSVAALIKPTDASMALFASTAMPHAYGEGSIGRSLEFGSGNTIWQKRKGDRLLYSSFNVGTASIIAVSNYNNFPASLGPVAVDLTRNLVAGIDFSASPDSPDTLDLYDVSNFNDPLLVARYPFPTNSQLNGNFIGQVIFAGDRVYAVDGNNGMVAFTIVAPAAAELTITRSGADVVLSWLASANGYVLQGTASLSPATWATVSGTPTLIGNTYSLTESAATGNKFYRLCRGCP
jgi:hypothetical protein